MECLCIRLLSCDTIAFILLGTCCFLGSPHQPLAKAAGSTESLVFLLPSYFAHHGLSFGCALPHLPPDDRAGKQHRGNHTGERRGMESEDQTFLRMKTQSFYPNNEFIPSLLGTDIYWALTYQPVHRWRMCRREFPSVMLNLVCPFGGTAGHLGCQ